MSGSARPGQLVVVLTWRGRVGLFRSGAQPGQDAGLWRCLYDVLPADEDVIERAANLLLDATGLAVSDLEELRPGPVVLLREVDGQSRSVRTVLARTDRRRLRIDEPHLAHRWVPPDRLARFDGQVSWLGGRHRLRPRHRACEGTRERTCGDEFASGPATGCDLRPRTSG